MLHHVSDDPAYESLKPFCISRSSFVQLLDYLEANEYETVLFTDLEKGGQSTGRRRVILSFDDCPKHLFDFAIPELVKRGMRGVFYMPVAHMGQYNSWDVEEGRAKVQLMDASDLLELQRLGMEIGGHSWHHIKLKDVTSEVLAAEVATCRKILEEILHQPLVSFAYPFGSVPAGGRAILSREGFEYGLSIYQPVEHQYALRRFIYHDGDTEGTLRKKLSWQYRWYRFFTDPLKKY